MNLVDPTTQQPTVTKAVKPGTPAGAYADPVQMGQMIQQMYPQYKNFDAATLGQRWISLHTPQATTTSGTTDPLLSPGTPTQNAPDLSGLSQFATPIKQPKPQTRVIISGLTGNNTGGAQLSPMSVPIQYSPQQTQKPLASSTADISKLGF